eukprot:SAG22_NODE_5751_length_959_cov_2.123256_1_plen_25_part_10
MSVAWTVHLLEDSVPCRIPALQKKM